MITKQKALEAINEMPDKFEEEELIERIIFIAKLDKALQQSENGQVIPIDEVKLRLSKRWSK
jgi:hypothetical protein